MSRIGRSVKTESLVVGEWGTMGVNPVGEPSFRGDYNMLSCIVVKVALF